MKNVLIISTIEEELLSNVDDGTNRLFINGSEIPSTDWMGTGNYTATVEGHAITIAKIDVDSLDGLNVSLAKTADYIYEMRRRVPTTIVVDDALSTSSINPVQNKVITNALGDKVAKSGDTMTGGLKVNDGGLYVKGRVYGDGDDEGIVVGFADNKWAGVMLGGSSGRHAAFYLKDDTPPTPPFLRYRDANNNTYDVKHPAKNGTMALSEDVLPLTGGIIHNTTEDAPLTIQGRDDYGVYLRFKKNNGNTSGYIGIDAEGEPAYRDGNNSNYTRLVTFRKLINYYLIVEAVSRSISQTLAAGANGAFSVSVIKEGYIPMGIIGWYGSGTSSFAMQELYIHDNKAKGYFKNITGSQATLNSLVFHILYMRSYL